MKIAELRRHETELGFRPADAVRWLSPVELWRVSVRVVLSSVFADYADKRELQASLPAGLLPAPQTTLERDGEVWVDFVADLGDGFDATYTVALLLACEKLEFTPPPGSGARVEPLPRASLLVLGGDEVYPAASAREYNNRMKGPYRAALRGADEQPLMVVLPGNHDWYDGLTSFLRLFAQGRPIGGWRTQQTRSYFAVQLPHRWWLLGLDSQFGNELDDPQLRYFEEHVSRQLQPGDSVILCAATPSWVHTVQRGDADAFNSLHWFDRQIIRTRPNDDGERVPTGASVRLWITGDSHHYARFAEHLPGDPPDSEDTPAQEAGKEPYLSPDPRRRQLVTCGLGGAFLSATHRLPEDLPLPPRQARMRRKDDPVRFARAEVCYPDRETSKKWARRLAVPWPRYWLPRRNHGFGTLAAGGHVAVFLVLSFLLGLTLGQRPVSAVRTASVTDALHFSVQVAVAAAIVLLTPCALRLVRTRILRPPLTAVAVLLQLLVASTILIAAVAVDLPSGTPGWLVLAAGCAWAAVAGWVLGSEAFAAFVLSARSGQVFGWQMSGQAVEDNKGFVRMHIDSNGALTLYPLVVDEVCHDWELEPDPVSGDKRPVPAGRLPVPRLLEDPIVVAPTGEVP